MPAGRPTDYKPEYADIAKERCLQGATDQELADEFGVSVRSIYRWKNEHPEFCHALKLGKELPDTRVERSLYERALGYERDEVDIRVVNGEIVQTPIRKFYPPDTTAAIFWLKNRKPEEWRDRTVTEHTGANGAPIAIAAVTKNADGMDTEDLAKFYKDILGG